MIKNVSLLFKLFSIVFVSFLTKKYFYFFMNFSSELCFDREKVRWKELLESARNGGFLLVNNSDQGRAFFATSALAIHLTGMVIDRLFDKCLTLSVKTFSV